MGSSKSACEVKTRSLRSEIGVELRLAWSQIGGNMRAIEIGLRSLGSENQILPGQRLQKAHFFSYVKTNFDFFYNTM